MSRWRSSMVLLGICVVAVLIGALRLATQPAEQPPGSSLSSTADGALALYTWMSDLGVRTERLNTRRIDPAVGAVVMLQPPTVVDSTARAALNAVADGGGTLVLSGDSLQWLLAARAYGVTVDTASPTSHAVTPDGLSLPISVRFRLHADAATPILLADDGQWLGLEMPYRNGRLIVIGSALPLTNTGLSDPSTARFVYRTMVAPLVGQTVAFDEFERSPALTGDSPSSVNQLLFQTSAGLAIVYAALLTFFFLLLAGRRLGPALAEYSAAEARRTMYEHIQMLADLYRRAGQLQAVRAAFGRHYARSLARGTVSNRHATEFAEALRHLESARTEAELVSAVATIGAIEHEGLSSPSARAVSR
jgi:hypothetical protein